MFNCVLFVYVLFLSLVRKKKIPKRKYIHQYPSSIKSSASPSLIHS